MMAKSQDIVVLLKWLSSPNIHTYSDLANELGMSVGEVHAASQRAEKAGLFDAKKKKPKAHALLEYLLHGVKYAFPATLGAPVRGVPTSYAAPVLSDYFGSVSDESLPPVWPDPDGKVRGYAMEPLFGNVPYAVGRDQRLYELLALVDAVRGGRARERKIAADELQRRLEAEPVDDFSTAA